MSIDAIAEVGNMEPGEVVRILEQAESTVSKDQQGNDHGFVGFHECIRWFLNVLENYVFLRKIWHDGILLPLHSRNHP